MKSFLTLVVAIGFIVTQASRSRATESQSETTTLQGVWICSAFIYKGTKRTRQSDPEPFHSEWHFEDSTLDIRMKNKVLRQFKYTVDATASPKRFDAEYIGSDEGEKRLYAGGVHGIYEIDDTTFVRCYIVGDPETRPTVFESKQGTKHILVVLQRKEIVD
jgi:uncharacterized protein (TIGR03067 family)